MTPQDTYLETTYMTPGGVYQPQLIQMENLGVVLNEIFVFLIENASVMAPAEIPTKHCWCLRLLQNNAARLCPLPRPSAG